MSDARSDEDDGGAVVLGLDRADSVHVYQPARDRITVLDGRGIEHVQRLDGRSVSEWQAYVAARRGWRRRETVYVSARDLLGGAA